MKGISKYEGIKIKKGSVAKVIDPLTVEQALQIDINGEAFTVVMQTPGDEVDLARGLLFAEDVLNATAEFETEHFENESGRTERINIKVDPLAIGDGYKSSRSLLSVSSCGICGKQSLEDLQIQAGSLNQTNVQWSVTELFAMQQKMVDAQVNFKVTGGCHGVAAFSKSGDLLTLKEDIGRHNAMDKVVGSLIQHQQLKAAKIVTFSGRISYEIVSKAFRAKIPVIMAVSAPSTLAIDFAKEYGISLISFARNGQFTCYTNCAKFSAE